MACSECKKKGSTHQQIVDSTTGIEKAAKVFVVLWTLLGLYGLYSLVRIFL